MNIDWSEAPEGATHYHVGNKGFYRFAKSESGFYGFGGFEPTGKRPDCFSPGTLIKRPTIWTGVGLPPVGFEIEAMMRRNMLDGYAWHRAKVVHGPLPGSEGEVLVFCLETTSPAWVDEFRPIRTPEQIAADAREKTVREVYDSCNGQGRSVLEMLGEAYDAGRKQVGS